MMDSPSCVALDGKGAAGAKNDNLGRSRFSTNGGKRPHENADTDP